MIEALAFLAFLIFILLLLPGAIVLHWDKRRENKQKNKQLRQFSARTERAERALAESKLLVIETAKDVSRLQIRCSSLRMENEQIKKSLAKERILNSILRSFPQDGFKGGDNK